MISEEILLKILSYTDKSEVIATAGSCRLWRSTIRGPRSVHLIRSLFQSHYPSLNEAVSKLGNTGLIDFFLRTERVRYSTGIALRRSITTTANSVRNKSEELIGLDCSGRDDPYAPPTSGTSVTAIPNASGCFDEPVYYDWGANWDRVSELVESEEVQLVLMDCINEVADGYYWNDWDDKTIWPILFMSHRRYGNGEQDALMKRYLSPLQVKELNGMIADHMQTTGETSLTKEYNPKKLAMEIMISSEVYEFEEDEYEKYKVDEMVDSLYEDVYQSGPGTQAAEKVLYDKNGPIKDRLLCTMGSSYTFMPLNYILAKRVSPEDTELKVYVGNEYSVVVDERRNIVFDNFWYFCGISASEALAKSKNSPLSATEFDYSLGGLIR